jgi:hypothetical protein
VDRWILRDGRQVCAEGTNVENLEHLRGAPQYLTRHEDVFDLLDRAQEVKSVTWFESCGKNDPLLSVNERFARKLRERRASLDLITTPGGYHWQS